MGVPVIVTSIPGLIDAVVPDETGLVVPPKDAIALQTAMERMYDDAPLREQLGVAAHNHILNHFEQEKMFEYILEDRKKLLGEQ